MTITLQTDSVSYNHKPTHNDISVIKPRLSASEPVNLTLKELEKRILSGITYTPAILRGGSKAENWQCQQVFCIDVDNEDKNESKPKKGEKAVKKQSKTPLEVTEVLKRCESWNITPALIYETFSSSPEWLKFRIVFISKEVITDGKNRDLIQLGLQEIFPECDSTCKNRDRLFFGGKNTLYINENAVCDFGSITQLGRAQNDRQAFEKYVNNNYSYNELDKLKRNFDFLGYIRNFGGIESKAGRLIRFNPCPICGHNDDFYYYPETNSFKCFGANGNVGGTIIDFIMHTQNIDKTSATSFFKYQLCGVSKNEEKAKFRTERVELEDEYKILHKAVDNLKEPMNRVINAYYFEDKKTPQIAEEMGISHSTVSSLKAKAMRCLRRSQPLLQLYKEEIYHEELNSMQRYQTRPDMHLYITELEEKYRQVLNKNTA